MANSVIQLRLLPTPGQAELLAETVRRCNAAATDVAKVAWVNKTFRRFDLHRLVYKRLRSEHGLGAQAAIHVIGRVAGAYANRSATRKRAHVFRPAGAISYDSRMLSFSQRDRAVSLWTVAGRQSIAYAGRTQDLISLESLPIGECDLLFRNGKWLLKCSVSVPERVVREPVNGFLGLDVGISLIAVTSDGEVLPGDSLSGTVRSNGHVRAIKERRYRQRRRLQSIRTRSARRRMKSLSSRESRFVSDINHQISSHVVREAERTGRGIALENLQGIRERARASRSQRRTLHGWSFRQLRSSIEYKAARVGLLVVAVDPAYTSQACPDCGHTDSSNRPCRSRFKCVRCGLAGPADHIAARNIAARAMSGRAAVNQPNAS